MHLRYRAVCVLLLVLGGLISLQPLSRAQGAGSELAETVNADTAGDGAYIVLQSVDAFPSNGGEAVFEPGTENEEAFTYASADAETNRLTGLSRPAPIAHPTGTFVQAPPHQPAGSGATPGPAEPSPNPSETPGENAEDGSTSTGSSEAAEVAPPDVCDTATDQTCIEILGGIIGDPPSIGEACGQLTSACNQAEQIIGELDDGLDTGDPCDPDNIGQTCVGYVNGLIQEAQDFLVSAVGDPVGERCDPDDTDQTCEEYAHWFAPQSASYSSPVETVIPVPDLGGSTDDLHKQCFLFTKVTKLAVDKPADSLDAKEYAEGYIRSNCGERRIPGLKMQAYIFHHSVVPFFGSTISTNDSSEGTGPGPVAAHAFQEVRIFPDHGYLSTIDFFLMFRATLGNGDPVGIVECYRMIYGSTSILPVACGEGAVG